MRYLVLLGLVFGCSKSSAPVSECDSDADNCNVTESASSPQSEDVSNDTGENSASDGPSDSGESPDVEDSHDTGEWVGPEENLIKNPGFEFGESDWNVWGGAVLVSDHVRSGDGALMATGPNGAEQVVSDLEANTVYRLSGWAKVRGSEPMLIGVKDYGGDEIRMVFTESEYSEASLTFTTGFSVNSAVVYAYKHGTDGEGFADDLTLIREGPSDRTLVWSDEFDGSGVVDESKWSFEEGFIRNEEVQWYQPDNAFRDDGLLVIEARTDDRPNPDYIPGSSDWRTRRETITHTSSSLSTQDSFDWLYGHLVVRAKVTNLTGTWPAIWTLGTRCEWPSNGEVDVMENYGGDILANFAWGTDSRWTPEWDASRWPVMDFDPGWTDQFHIWELEWTESRMIIRMDGLVLNDVSLDETINGSAACAGENPFRQNQFLRLNLALGGAGGSLDGLGFPNRFLVDYVRVYQ
jgi:beta-glucanase (GH16 family)